MSVEDLLREVEQEPNESIDTTTPEGFKKYVSDDRSLSSNTIKSIIYMTHDADKIKIFTDIYADILISREEIEESASKRHSCRR
ncbi:hypothetical protein ACFQ3J_26940 [Paenibacillus provencensis]|uniref:Uncharacterized protein n=1 Tax=Paenibacillus provencensis TaxID=441151 RepID=A0ABW3Q4T4_9BACL|nr:hypothetical protein [Paenibacillus sp. MER 78]MCM3130079.1 hypothetical protein [Paenibacillus sp. MER 78]